MTPSGVPADATGIASSDPTLVKPITAPVVKRPKVAPVRKPKTAPSTRRLEDAPSRYIPGESLGGTRSLGGSYRYTEGRLDSE
jgi:hypothetical protein